MEDCTRLATGLAEQKEGEDDKSNARDSKVKKTGTSKGDEERRQSPMKVS